jgi:hypothetical protein
MAYIQTRFESNKKDKSLGQILHNTRTIKPSYLRNELFHNQYKNEIYIFDNNEFKHFTQTYRSDELLINKLLKNQLENEVEKVKSKSKNYRIAKSAITINSIITLSNSINDDLENGKISKDKLSNLFLKTTQEIAKQHNLEIMNITIHYDEKTPHAHIAYKNYNENGKAQSQRLKKEYSLAQDTCETYFKDIGYVRGKSKEETHSTHLNTKLMHEKEIEELKIMKNNLIDEITNISKLANDILQEKQKIENDYNELNKRSIKELKKYIKILESNQYINR